MGVQPAKNLTDRELRSLDLKEFLALVHADIQELDERRRQRRKLEKGEPSPVARKGRHRVEEPEPEEEEALPPLSLHLVVCCGKKMGSFPGLARVRCPFCERWHTAGEFPTDEGSP